MQDDIAAVKRLSALYPNTILTVRYEDYVLKTRQTIDHVFEHVGRPPPKNIYSHIDALMNAKKSEGTFDIKRADGKASVDKWRSRNSLSDIELMNERCSKVLHESNYKLQWCQQTIDMIASSARDALEFLRRCTKHKMRYFNLHVIFYYAWVCCI